MIGRDEELEALQRLVDEVAGLPSVVVLDGEPGSGKTTLIDAACRGASAGGHRVLRCSPTQWEGDLTFAALGDVVEPVLDEVAPALAEPQRRALAGVLSRDEGDHAVQPGTVSRAFLETLRSLASTSPVCVAVDDAHWLDPETLRTFAFAIRRIVDEPILMIVARRTELALRTVPLTEALPDRTRVITVGPLSLGAISFLLREHGVSLPRPTLQRVHDASRGNPFLAIEISRTLEAAGVAPGPEDPLPVPATISALLRERLSRLGEDARETLAIAAAMSHPTVDGVVSVAGPDSAGALEEAEQAGVVVIDGGDILFTHPLLADQVTEDLSPAESRRLHTRLADVEADAESRARHLAMAAEGPDAKVALALDRAAEVANARGAPAAAAELAERGLVLTPEAGDARSLRAVECARYHFLAGDTQRASFLLSQLLETLPPGRVRGQALAALGRLHLFTDDLGAATTLLGEASREPEAPEASRAEAEEGLAWSLLLARGSVRAVARHAERAARLAERIRSDMLRMEALAVGGMADCLLGRSPPGALTEQAIAEGEPVPGMRVIRHPLWALAVIRAWTEDLAGAGLLLDRLRTIATERGDEGSLPRILLAMSYVRMEAGDWRGAGDLAAEGEEAAVQGAQRPQVGLLLYSKAVLDAHLGDERSLGADPAPGSPEPDVTWMIRRVGAGHLALSRSEFERAHHELAPLVDRVVAAGIVEPGAKRFVADEVEALVGLGRLEEAEGLLRPFERAAKRLDRPAAIAGALRGRALLLAARHDGDRAASVLGRALEQPLGPFERARTLLVLGTVYRRAQRKAKARAGLDEAEAAFDRLGARTWAARARAERSRIGGRTAATGLSPTEERVVQLVAEGSTNREVAAATFVSLKAVEATLTRVYAKLGVRSRTELVRRFGPGPKDATEL